MKCERENCNHKATISFSIEPMFAQSHGSGEGENICLCCYIKEIENGLKLIQDNLKKRKAKLEKEGCK